MKRQTRSLLTLICAASVSLLIIASPARAGYLVTLDQVGSNVVANGSGAIDLTGLSFLGTAFNNVPAQIQPKFRTIVTGPPAGQTVDFYTGLTGPTSFGSGDQTVASSGSGDYVGIQEFQVLQLFVPPGYMSDAALADTSTYLNATFASLGVTPGTYEWTWGTGLNQNFTLQIGPASVPDAGSTFGLLLVALGALFGVSRFRSLRLA